jgi:hypothetical protein
MYPRIKSKIYTNLFFISNLDLQVFQDPSNIMTDRLYAQV